MPFPPGEFSVYQFFENDMYEAVVRFTDAETAVNTAKNLTTSVGGRIGTTKRVIITDGGDSPVLNGSTVKVLCFQSKRRANNDHC